MIKEWVEIHGRTTIVHLQRDYGSTQVEALRDAENLLLNANLDSERPKLLLDMGGTDYFGSEFLSILVRCHQRISDLGGRLAICRANCNLMAELAAANLDILLPVYDTRAEALRGLGEKIR